MAPKTEEVLQVKWYSVATVTLFSLLERSKVYYSTAITNNLSRGRPPVNWGWSVRTLTFQKILFVFQPQNFDSDLAVVA